MAARARTNGLEAGTVLQDTYRIGRKIGQGGMGEVYEATHARLAGRYAVKLLFSEIASEEVFGRFRREALVTSSLRHPNIVQVIDFNRTPEGMPYLVMEFLEGIDLATEVRRTGAMPVPRVVKLVEQVASALAAVHKRGIVHRDLKPHNLVLVQVEGQEHELVKVLDFGVSKVREATSPLTRESTLIGTPQYMSPEQALGRQQEIDVAADQFSLGVITYELLTGQCPFRGDSVPAVVYQVVYENPPPLSAVRATVTPAVAAVVARAMAKNAAERYPTVVAYARALTAAAAGLPEPENLLATGPVPTLVDPTPAGSLSGLHELSATTLGTASGESVVRPRRRAPGRWAVLAGLGLTAVVAVAVSMKRPGARPAVERAPATAPAPPPKPQVTPLPSPPPATVTVEIENGPPGLRVLLDGAPIEPPISLPRGAEAHLLRFEATDYKPYELRVDGKRDRLVRLEMVKRRKPASGKMLLDF